MVEKDAEEVRKARQTALSSNDPQESSKCIDNWIYRGQASLDWNLDTTLERFLKNELSNEKPIALKDYISYLESILPALNSLSEIKFASPAISKTKTQNIPLEAETLKLLAYTRHLGFPSPLLDWSQSYYVAAYFAFAYSEIKNDAVIYAFQESNGNTRGGWVERPIINGIGNYIETHPRHHRQQSEYTYCGYRNGDEYFFTNHLYATREDSQQNHIKKFVIKKSERSKILKQLYKMNINEYTLMGSDDALMKSLAYREIVLNKL